MLLFEALVQYSKVRRPYWYPELYWYWDTTGTLCVSEDKEPAVLYREAITATDWGKFTGEEKE